MSVQGWTKTNRAGIYRKEVETGAKYRIRISVLDADGNRQREQKTLPDGTTLEEAAKKRTERIAALKEPDDPDPASITIASFMKRWLARKSRQWSDSYTAKNRRILAQKVLPYIGHLMVDGLRMEDVLDWIEWAEAQTTEAGDEEVPYAQGTLDGWWKAMKRVVKALWRAGHVSRKFRERVTGRDGLTGPQSPRRGVRCTRGMSADELGAFLDAAKRYKPNRYAELVTLAFTGMRAGELYALKWEYVDEDRGVIWIRRAHWRGVEKPPKTGETKRAPLASIVEEVLQEHRQRQFAEQHPGVETGLIFPSDVGTHRYPSSIRKPMRQLSEYIELGWKASPQNLRRTFVNLMRRAGVGKATRRSIVGHQNDGSEEPYLDVPIEEQHAAMDEMLTTLG